ncbi:hypothetical protein GGI42DRAFT_333481 [Trichoderma sp. SZMC 28013]
MALIHVLAYWNIKIYYTYPPGFARCWKPLLQDPLVRPCEPLPVPVRILRCVIFASGFAINPCCFFMQQNGRWSRRIHRKWNAHGDGRLVLALCLFLFFFFSVTYGCAG